MSDRRAQTLIEEGLDLQIREVTDEYIQRFLRASYDAYSLTAVQRANLVKETFGVPLTPEAVRQRDFRG